jgi:Ca2+-binding EF-hand superfamily protein
MQFLGRLRAMMGCTTFTITFIPDAAIPGQSDDVVIMCLKLGYTLRDIDLMYTNFKKLDVYHNNRVHFASFCAMNRINNLLGELIFHRLLEVDKHKEITFENYLVCIWNAFSVLDNSNMAELAFQVFDTDKSGK